MKGFYLLFLPFPSPNHPQSRGSACRRAWPCILLSFRFPVCYLGSSLVDGLGSASVYIAQVDEGGQALYCG